MAKKYSIERWTCGSFDEVVNTTYSKVVAHSLLNQFRELYKMNLEVGFEISNEEVGEIIDKFEEFYNKEIRKVTNFL
ncbi:MAG: hypothetical protein ABIP51_15050 [Bacteroidia bacterium]